MSMSRLHSSLALAAGVALIAASPSTFGAPAQRTFVKSNGVDSNPCTLAAPCRSFAAAMTNTLATGEVIVLDSAGYGPVSIAQSVSIIAPPGVYAGVSVSSGAGITVSGASITVVLQGLSINGTGGANGILFTSGSELYVVNCSISNMTSTGIFATAGGGRLIVSDTTVRDNTLFGVLVSGTVNAVFDRVRAEGNGSVGIYGAGGASMSVRESVASNNAGGGVWAQASTGATTKLTVDGTVISDNNASGTAANANDPGSLAILDVIRSTMARNNSGYGASASAVTSAFAVMTVAQSLMSENAFGGMAGGGALAATTAFASGNTFTRNSSAGILQSGTATVHTRSNNAGEQVPPTSGTVTAVPGF